MSHDQAEAFLDTLPELGAAEAFWFRCHPDVPCFTACCSDLTMPLTPYDVLRLCQGLHMGSEAFVEEYARVSCYPETGFPVFYLRMEDTGPRQCPFLESTGCGVYAHRSTACRTYPLGRATRPVETAATGAPALEERYFIVREDHCKGFAEQQQWTRATWLADQGLVQYNAMNDLYALLMARFKAVANGAKLGQRHATMALLCLYQQDRFLDFIQQTGLLGRLAFTGPWAEVPRPEMEQAILTNPETRLHFGFAWMELALLGNSSLLSPAA